ncbi:uncharacterized protein LOC130895480 isoform X2 [Diorhabda carinulata]|uniref:uncharacterized protein LOC130895480 isoform X2 n=1 Tax=Diorhabda carinulata TaxID=1163345 RepID=UPI0025A10E89|nr:uncharacterized protein LOC130895480 isoform X2 [Diorhabda carinulata]
MEQTVIKDEIEIHDDFICNTKVKQEFNDEMSSTAYQNVNTSSMHHIKEEISDDLETVREFEKSMVTIKKEESCNTFDKLNTQNKMEYMSIETIKPTKSQDRMDMEQTVIKDEIEIHDDFICNTKVKQEFNDEMPSAPYQNVNTTSMHHIKEEISDDLETVREFEESMVTIKKEESCNTFDKLNIKNNFEYMRIKTGKSTKTQVERDAHVSTRCEMDDEKLIELVRKYEFLYNLQHPKYTDSAKKEMAWKEISEELKQSVLHLPGSLPKQKNAKRSIRNYKRRQRSAVEEILRESSHCMVPEHSTSNHEYHFQMSNDESMLVEVHETAVNVENNDANKEREINNLKEKIKMLEEQREALLRNIDVVKDSAHKKYQDALATVFTKGQIQKLMDPIKGKKIRWSSEDIASAISLRSVSPKAYRYLRTNSYPLPALSTLRRWVSSNTSR